jgi:ADP-heptose:LPS heptosyltransferase
MSETILAVRLRALGDVVLVTPALRALKRGHPGLALEVVTDPRYAPLLAWLPEVDHVWTLERSTFSALSLAGRLRRRRVRWAVDFFGNPRSASLVRMCGALATAGFDLRGRRHAYRVRVPRDAPGPGGRREHASAAHLRLAVAAGGIPDEHPARLALPEAARLEGRRLLEAAGLGREPAGRVIGLVPAGTWPTKTWPSAHAALLARRLMAAGREVVLLAGPGEDAVAAAVRSHAPGTRVLPPCDVAGLAGAIAHLEAVVGTDSGPRHLAAALRVATYAWFGPTHPDTWQPPGTLHGFWRSPLPCAGCDRTRCPHWSCMPALAPDEAAARVLDHLDRLESARGREPDLRPAAGA